MPVLWKHILNKMKKCIIDIVACDEFTGFPNRNYLSRKMKLKCEDAKKSGNSFALMMLDVDGFNHINNTLGYRLGNQLIGKVGQRLKNYLGNEKFICRYSGNQFAIVIPGLNTLKEYEDVARDVMDLFTYPFNMDMYELYVTISIGISLYPGDVQDPDSLIKCACTALLLAADEGKNRYKFYSSNMDISNYKQFMLRNDLHRAIEKNQVRVYYQPQVNLQTNEVLGAEALIRWEHPIWGLVTPDEFITMAEESGYIINLGNWLLRKVCSDYKKWLNDGLPAIKVSVNYSSIQFFQRNFIKSIKNTISEYGLNPQFLIIEITESILIKNSRQVIDQIKNLQALGIQVAIDDFGTGVSSLAYLNTFNLDILKIDRSFIKNIPSDKTSTIITRSLINLARDLGIELVAEGIENWDQLSYLQKLNCYVGQGFLYSQPVSEEDFMRMLAEKKCTPAGTNDGKVISYEERRKFFRINYPKLLEADMGILHSRGKRSNIGNIKVVIKDMGPGGLCFISNIKLPVKKDIILQFTTELLEKEIKVCGCPVWSKENEENLHEYGIKFICDGNERMSLINILNQVKIRMEKNFRITDGRFVSDSPICYFKVDSSRN